MNRSQPHCSGGALRLNLIEGFRYLQFKPDALHRLNAVDELWLTRRFLKARCRECVKKLRE